MQKKDIKAGELYRGKQMDVLRVTAVTPGRESLPAEVYDFTAQTFVPVRDVESRDIDVLRTTRDDRDFANLGEALQAVARHRRLYQFFDAFVAEFPEAGAEVAKKRKIDYLYNGTQHEAQVTLPLAQYEAVAVVTYRSGGTGKVTFGTDAFIAFCGALRIKPADEVPNQPVPGHDPDLIDPVKVAEARQRVRDEEEARKRSYDLVGPIKAEVEALLRAENADVKHYYPSVNKDPRYVERVTAALAEAGLSRFLDTHVKH